MTVEFRTIATLDDLARFFGYPNYAGLSRVVYHSKDGGYTRFEIPKRNGGSRSILAPQQHLRSIQRTLAAALDQEYTRPPKAVHGFLAGQSILTNADEHVGKAVVFNLDLHDFFTSIKFHHVLRLFRSSQFTFPDQVTTVLAQICCFEKALPQGAPTSPVVSNMICRRLDGDLAMLAKKNWCSYTRYADDITFSFGGDVSSLPAEIVEVANGRPVPGPQLSAIIQRNEFKINERKLRLADQSSRMEVTGLTVNRRRNVRRRYVRQVEAMLYAWDAHGLSAAQSEFNDKYDKPFRRSRKPKDFRYVVAGKLSFLLAVKGVDDSVYIRLASQFNELIDENMTPMPVPSSGGVRRPRLEFHTALNIYQSVKQLGTGGCATVISVTRADGRRYAIKYLTPEGVNAEKVRRFQNELLFCITAEHPNILKALEYGTAEVRGSECQFYVMPLYSGTLRTAIGRGLDPDAVVPIFSQILDGVEAAHFNGAFHRDLKPENILIDEAGSSIVVADFGIARFDQALMETSVKTRLGTRTGNFPYAAPEQRERGANVEGPADIYALGLVLNEMFTGRLAHGQEYVEIGSVAPPFAYLDELVNEMLRQDPAGRPDFAEVRRRLAPPPKPLPH